MALVNKINEDKLMMQHKSKIDKNKRQYNNLKPIFETDRFLDYKKKCFEMATNIDKWHEDHIVNNYFQNDDDFERLKRSPTKFDK